MNNPDGPWAMLCEIPGDRLFVIRLPIDEIDAQYLRTSLRFVGVSTFRSATRRNMFIAYELKLPTFGGGCGGTDCSDILGTHINGQTTTPRMKMMFCQPMTSGLQQSGQPSTATRHNRISENYTTRKTS